MTAKDGRKTETALGGGLGAAGGSVIGNKLGGGTRRDHDLEPRRRSWWRGR